MRKLALLAFGVFALPFLMGVSSCEQKLDDSFGIHATKNADGSYTVTADPAGGPVGSGIKLAQDATGGTPWGWIVGLAGSLVLGAAQTILKNRLQNSLNATVAGVSSFTVANPTQAPALLAHVDAAHDAAQVPGHVQDAIQGAISPT